MVQNWIDDQEAFVTFKSEIQEADERYRQMTGCTCIESAVCVNAGTPAVSLETRTDHDENCPVHGIQSNPNE